MASLDTQKFAQNDGKQKSATVAISVLSFYKSLTIAVIRDAALYQINNQPGCVCVAIGTRIKPTKLTVEASLSNKY